MTAGSVLRRLVAEVPSIEPRHAFELAALVAGAKDVVRVVLERPERESALVLLAQLGCAVVPSPFGLATERESTLGDRFTFHVDANDPRASSFVLLVAREAKVARHACEVEAYGDNDDLGRLYGYPACCVAAYERIASGNDWLDQLVADVRLRGTGERPFYAANRIGSLYEGLGFLPDYFPCSLYCEGAMRLATSLRSAALTCDLDDIVAHTDTVLQRPIIAWRGLVIQPVDARRDGDTLQFTGKRALRFDWRPEEVFPNTLLDDVSAAPLDLPGVTLLDMHGRTMVDGCDRTGVVIEFRA